MLQVKHDYHVFVNLLKQYVIDGEKAINAVNLSCHEVYVVVVVVVVVDILVST